jgi:hypothetical protein
VEKTHNFFFFNFKKRENIILRILWWPTNHLNKDKKNGKDRNFYPKGNQTKRKGIGNFNDFIIDIALEKERTFIQ